MSQTDNPEEKPPFWGNEEPVLQQPDEILRILRKLPDEEGRKVYYHIRWLTKRLSEK
jgi:hypothetical protein